MKSTEIPNLDWQESKSALDEFLLTATVAEKVRYTLRIAPTSAIDHAANNAPPLPPDHPNVKFFINIEYGEFNYNYTVIENQKYKQFSRAAAQEFCVRDYQNYLQADAIKWCRPADFNPSLGVNHKLVGINPKHKAYYEIYSLGPADIDPGDWKAQRTFFAEKTNLKSGRKKILNSYKLRLWGKKRKPLSHEDCKKLCERDYAKSITSAREKI